MRAVVAACAVLLSASLFLAVAEAQIERSFIVDVKMQDAYFGTPEEKVEASPGDQNVPFTIALANVGSEDITAISGSLHLPRWFQPADGSAGAITAESETNSRTGEIFYLTFFLNLDDSVEIGRYPGTADVSYSRILESGTRTSTFDFDFRVTGESYITVATGDPFLMSTRINDIAITVSNNGTAAISNAEISIKNTQDAMSGSQLPTNMENVIISETRWDAGHIGPGSDWLLETTVYIPDSVRGQTLRLPIEISYFNAYGDRITEGRIVDFFVSAVSEGAVEVAAGNQFLTSLRTNEITLSVKNDGETAIRGVDVRIENAGEEDVLISGNGWKVADIEPGAVRHLEATVYVPDSMRGQTLRLLVEIDYFNAYGDRTTATETLDFLVLGLLDVSVYDVGLIELSGKPTIIGEIINEGNEDALFGFVTASPVGGSNIAESTQFIDEIQVDSPVPFNIPVEFDGEPRYGEHEIEITVRYKDSVREEFFVSHMATVSIPEPPPPERQRLFDNPMILIVVAVAAGVGILVAARRRRGGGEE